MSNGDGKDEKFLKGVAISVWQNSGDRNLCNWTRYAYSNWPFKYLPGVSTTQGKYKVGQSCNFWERYREDIELAHNAGCTSFRFSFEWAMIEPAKGVIDKQAIKRFHEMLDVMDEYGIVPNATLHHFTHPVWFEDLGAFEKEENLAYFVNYAKMMWEEFGSRIKLWATFNEPTCYIFLAYICAMAPPGYICNLITAGRVLLNLLKAHTAAYNAIKTMPGGSSAQVGLVHHHITFKPAGVGPLHLFSGLMAKWLEYFWGWDVVDHWMMTGSFEWKLPVLGTWITYKDPKGKPPCDWWGINYYSRPVLSFYLTTTCFPGEVMTDMYYPIYGGGLYEAIKRSSKYSIPMYITETGIADKTDDRRALMIDEYMAATMRALADGYDVRGFYYWTLMDNFEWAAGYNMRFGLYRWEPDGTVDRVLREGSKVLVAFYKTLPDQLQALRELARNPDWRDGVTSVEREVIAAAMNGAKAVGKKAAAAAATAARKAKAVHL